MKINKSSPYRIDNDPDLPMCVQMYCNGQFIGAFLSCSNVKVSANDDWYPSGTMRETMNITHDREVSKPLNHWLRDMRDRLKVESIRTDDSYLGQEH